MAMINPVRGAPALCLRERWSACSGGLLPQCLDHMADGAFDQ
jgi:hypothetical protein